MSSTAASRGGAKARRGGEAAAAETARRLAASGVEAVALAIVINSGVTLVKTIPLRRFEEAVTFGLGLSPVFTVFQVDDQITSSPHIGGPTGDTRLVPDPARTVGLAASPGWALAPVDQLDQEGEPYPGCPRTFARRMLERLAGHGLELRGGYEIEFFLGHRATPGPDEADPTPAHTGPAYGAIALADVEPFATALIRAFEEQGTGVMQFHPEYSTGQLELSVPHGVGIATADTHLVVRHTIRAVARNHGYVASFAPVVFAGRVGNGNHLHLSLWDRKGKNLFQGGRGPEGMTRQAEAFTAGVLAALPALTAVTAPSVPSYERLQPHRWSGPWACWGRENREAALRFVTGMVGSRPDAANLEVKSMDPASNPYLALGAIVAAGIDGLDRELPLPEPVVDDPASIPARKRRSLGINRLPDSLSAAIRELEKSSMLRESMGDVLFDSFLATRRAERDVFEGQDPEDVVRAHRWRY
ncbi:MAG TPA: glutamine synthetase family protein [Actinomycetota bacterium]|nr:glutamine synthetase family protein [Actinomycetota bacterium]